MDEALRAVVETTALFARDNSTNNGTSNGTTTDANTEERPKAYKTVGIILAVSSGLFIGVSFVLKKKGLLKSNVKYNEAAGEGYGYLKNAFWWTGMTLMIIGEICNFVAYAFVDAILVTPLGALSVVVTTILSAIFLKERLSLVGKIGCFLCIVGSVVIVMNAPEEASAATIQEMQHFVIAPGFLVYAGIIIVGATFTALWAGPRYGKKSMLVYISICSWVGGLSVVATQGLGAAIVTQINGTPQFNQWFLYVLLVFVVTTLVTEIIYLNKALNIFNAAMVTPTYYVYFTSTTIITSAVLFRGFKGTPTSIVTVVLGFFTICSGVILLQLSKSAKDVPDAAVFSGNLDQMRTIAEQEQPESEPKADAIRGTAAIVRRFSVARQKMEMDEAKRLAEDRALDLQPIGEDEQIEWDGLRRRRTTISSNPSLRARESNLHPDEAFSPRTMSRQNTPRVHPPLGMSHFPEEVESSLDPENRPGTGGSFSSILGTIRRSRGKSLVLQGQPPSGTGAPQSLMHPVPLTEISVPAYKSGTVSPHSYGLPPGLQKIESFQGQGDGRHITIVDGAGDPRTTGKGGFLSPPQGPTPPPHSAKRQFSFNFLRRNSTTTSESEAATAQNAQSRSPMIRHRQLSREKEKKVGRKHATEEERLGLVKGDSAAEGKVPLDSEDDDAYDTRSSDEMGFEDQGFLREKEGWGMSSSSREFGLQSSPPRTPPEEAGRGGNRNLTPKRKNTGSSDGAGDAGSEGRDKEEMSEKQRSASSVQYEEQKRKWEESQKKKGRDELPRPPSKDQPPDDERGRGGTPGAFI